MASCRIILQQRIVRREKSTCRRHIRLREQSSSSTCHPARCIAARGQDLHFTADESVRQKCCCSTEHHIKRVSAMIMIYRYQTDQTHCVAGWDHESTGNRRSEPELLGPHPASEAAGAMLQSAELDEIMTPTPEPSFWPVKEGVSPPPLRCILRPHHRCMRSSNPDSRLFERT